MSRVLARVVTNLVSKHKVQMS
ncbi:hypothetical protein MTR67_043916 [Solanum verrucosum]|uniref:Uncharacterized protein n=1 Tax=Solanum verrucosum TaxID=315347 RepID=A0AAF0USW9_SOLVR|nr:hypothetical protein MTR67_043916 [Solanum verrucosum]